MFLSKVPLVLLVAVLATSWFSGDRLVAAQELNQSTVKSQPATRASYVDPYEQAAYPNSQKSGGYNSQPPPVYPNSQMNQPGGYNSQPPPVNLNSQMQQPGGYNSQPPPMYPNYQMQPPGGYNSQPPPMYLNHQMQSPGGYYYPPPPSNYNSKGPLLNGWDAKHDWAQNLWVAVTGQRPLISRR